MYLSHYKPLDPLFEDSLFGRNFWDTLLPAASKDDKTIKPRTNIHEDDKNYYIDMELPGVDKKDITVEVKHSTLIIKGERKSTRKQSNEHYHRTESWYGSFHREFSLDETINTAKIHASHKDGVLEVQLPKKTEHLEKQAVKTITIQ